MKKYLILCLSTLVLILLNACESTEEPNVLQSAAEPKETEKSSAGDGDADSDSDMDIDIDKTDDTKDDEEEEKDPNKLDEVCQAIDFSIEAAPVRIMILIDKSASMGQGAPSTKWVQAKKAINTILDKFGEQIQFGLDSFARQGVCGMAPEVAIDTKKKQAAEIIEMLNTWKPGTFTPLYLGMKNFSKADNPDYAPEFTDGHFPSYLLVISDGIDTCGQAGRPNPAPGGALAGQQLSSLTTSLLDQGIKSFVIGFGAQAAPAQLNEIAANGGTTMNKFIPAMNEEELTNSLTEIVSLVASCTYNIGGDDDESVDMTKANFYFDGEPIGMDQDCKKGKGWTWTDKKMNSVTFCKAACQKIRKGKVEKVSAEFGCPPIQIF